MRSESGAGEGAGPHEPRALVVFARAPERGRVKTRLAAALGDDAALSIYRALGERVMRQVAAIPDCRVAVACAPDDGTLQVRAWLGERWHVEGQGTDDLGARMDAAISRRFAEGARRVIVIGTDCPGIDGALIEEAFAALDVHDVVIGPATDGGYYLIGVRRASPALFREVPWSSADTLRVTLDRAAAAGLSVALLGERHDIDTAGDWAAWLRSAGFPGDQRDVELRS